MPPIICPSQIAVGIRESIAASVLDSRYIVRYSNCSGSITGGGLATVSSYKNSRQSSLPQTFVVSFELPQRQRTQLCFTSAFVRESTPNNFIEIDLKPSWNGNDHVLLRGSKCVGYEEYPNICKIRYSTSFRDLLP